MPLIQCPDCAESISDAAPACIKCGRPIKAPSVAAAPVESLSVEPEVSAAIQGSKLRQDLGSAIGFVGLPIAMVAGFATSATIGWIVAFSVVIWAATVHYGKPATHRPTAPPNGKGQEPTEW